MVQGGCLWTVWFIISYKIILTCSRITEMILGVTWPFGMKVGKGDIIGYGVLHINRHAFRQSRWAWTMCFFYMSLLLPWIAQCSSLSVLHPVTGARECGMIHRGKRAYSCFSIAYPRRKQAGQAEYHSAESWHTVISFDWVHWLRKIHWIYNIGTENSWRGQL